MTMKILDGLNFGGYKFNAGMFSELDEIRLRLAIVDNFEIGSGARMKKVEGTDDQYEIKVDPLKYKVNDNVIINMQRGTLAIKWLDDIDGGMLRSKNEFGPKSEDDLGNQQLLDIASPFIWSDGNKWCGISYTPCVGSIAIIGFRKVGMPVLLGFISPKYYSTINPYAGKNNNDEMVFTVNPGEIKIQGYGGAFIHWKQKEELELSARRKKGQINSEGQKNESEVALYVVLKALQKRIAIKAEEIQDSKVWTTIFDVYPQEAVLSTAYQESGITTTGYFRFRSGQVIIENGDVLISKANNVTVNETENVNIVASGSINLTSGSLNINSGSINMSATGTVTITGSRIDLN